MKGITKKNIKEFDLLLEMIESPNQLLRIQGRLRFPKFEKRFTKQQLDYMAKKVGVKRT